MNWCFEALIRLGQSIKCVAYNILNTNWGTKATIKSTWFLISDIYCVIDLIPIDRLWNLFLSCRIRARLEDCNRLSIVFHISAQVLRVNTYGSIEGEMVVYNADARFWSVRTHLLNWGFWTSDPSFVSKNSEGGGRILDRLLEYLFDVKSFRIWAF